MAYHDISGKLEIHSSFDQKEIIERLSDSLYSLKINATIQDDGELIFTIPFIKTVTRGYVFQGISSGSITVESHETNLLNLNFRLVTLPMRLAIIIMVLWVTLGIPAISSQMSEGFNQQNYFLFEFPAIAMIGFVFLVGRFFIKYKFVTFIRKSLSAKAEVIKQPVFGKYIDIRKILIFSCSGFLFLMLLIPTIIIINFIVTQSKVTWSYPIKNAVVAAPAISEGIAYFGSLNDIDGAAFYALDTTTGKELWTKPLGTAVSSSQILTDISVCFGTDDGIFHCLDRKNGSELWKFNPEQRNSGMSACDRCTLKLNTPAVDDDVIYVGSHDHNLYALDAQTGQLKWYFSTGGIIMDAPAIENKITYVGSYDGYVYSLDSGTGTEIQRYRIPSANQSETGEHLGVYATPLIDGTTIYAVNGALTALDIKSGEIKWQVFGASSYEDQIIGRPLLFNDLIVITTNNSLYGIDKVSGKTDWKYSNIKGSVFFAPTLYEEIVYFGDSSGFLYGVNVKTGRQILRYNMNYLDLSSYTNWFAEFVFSPAADEHRIYVKWFNHLYAMNK